MSINLVATDVSRFLSCTKKYEFEKSKSFLTVSSKKNNLKTGIGNLIHFVLEKFFYTELRSIDNALIEKYYLEFISEKNRGEFFDDKFFKTIEGIKTISIIKKMVDSIYKIQNIETYKFLPEEYYQVPPFGGQIDLILESEEKVITIDYKTGNITSTDNINILDSIINQFKVYQVLIENKYPTKILEFYILDKKGALIQVDYSKSDIETFKESILDLVDRFNNKIYTFGKVDTCFTCSYSAFCDNYTPSEQNENIEVSSNIQSKVTSVKKELNMYIIESTGLGSLHNGLKVKLVMDSDDCSDLVLENDSVINLNSPKFLQQNEDVSVLKLGFGSITLSRT